MAQSGEKTIWNKILTAALAAINIFAGIGLLVSGYAGTVNPLEHSLASVIAMTFPIWLAGQLAVAALALIIRWKAALPGIIALIAALPPILNYSPIHLPIHEKDNEETFTVMSYNVFLFTDQQDQYPGNINPTISAILRDDPDIACLQEAVPFLHNKTKKITSEQLDSLHAQYPYMYLSGVSQAILSKFPVTPVAIGFERDSNQGSADMACFRAEIMGHTVTIFNVHLQSFYLGSEDRDLYMKLTKLEGNRNDIAEMRNQLLSKIRNAAVQRVHDTEQLIRYIKKYGGPNVIVCGDFNDVPGCYSLRMLAEEHLKDVYPEVGLGPMITYNSQRFYFCIDHILYRGDLYPIKMTRGKIRSSDHYPVEATFAIKKQ